MHQDGVTVPRTSCFEYPDSMRVINAFLHSVDPVHRYAAFVLTKNVTSRVHRDPRNGAACNMVVRISDFAEGGLWVQDPKRHCLSRISKDLGFLGRFILYSRGLSIWMRAASCMRLSLGMVTD